MLSKLSKTVFNSVQKNSPVILTGASIIGVASTAILAVKATPKAMRIMDELNSPTKKEVVFATWREYLPSVLVGSATVACMIGSGRIMNRRNAAIYGLYTLSEGALKDYQEKVIETIGTKKHRKVKDDINQDKVKATPPSGNVIMTGKGDVVILEVLSGRYFESNVEDVRKAMNDFNHDLFTDMFLSINDWYDRLGIPHMAIGNDIGWNVDDMLAIDFSTTLSDDNQPCIVIDYEVMPTARFRG